MTGRYTHNHLRRYASDHALAVFVLLVTTPFWYGLLKAGPPPTPEPPPNGASVCVAPLEYMRSSHMKLLDVWRDPATRYTWVVYAERAQTIRGRTILSDVMRCRLDDPTR